MAACQNDLRQQPERDAHVIRQLSHVHDAFFSSASHLVRVDKHNATDAAPKQIRCASSENVCRFRAKVIPRCQQHDKKPSICSTEALVTHRTLVGSSDTRRFVPLVGRADVVAKGLQRQNAMLAHGSAAQRTTMALKNRENFI